MNRTDVVGVADINQMCVVKRWQIVDLPTKSSLAEHSFRVAMIAKNLVREMGYGEDTQNCVCSMALVHDLEEVFTGDIPTPVKEFVNTEALKNKISPMVYRTFKETKAPIEARKFLHNVIKIADFMDALFELKRPEQMCSSKCLLSLECYIRNRMEEFFNYLNDTKFTGFTGKIFYDDIPLDEKEMCFMDLVNAMLEKPVTRFI